MYGVLFIGTQCNRVTNAMQIGHRSSLNQ